MSKKRTIRRGRRTGTPRPAEARPAETPPPPSASGAPPAPSAFDTSELEAIAAMDPQELAALMEAGPARGTARIGDRVQGVVTRRGPERSFVDIGAKAEAQILTADLGDAAEGDTVDAYVIDDRDGEPFLSTTPAGAAADRILADAAASGTPLEGAIVSRNPGGFDVRIGAVRAFCPVSQIDRFPNADLDTYVGRTFRFVVLETDGDVVVSRRAHQEALAEAGQDAFWASAAVGDVHEGVVASVKPFGVFVDLGGVQGLVPRGELGWGDADPAATIRRGDPITVRITGLHPDEGKVDLSARDPADDPWRRLVGTAFTEGGEYPGRVTGVETFGAFVELAPGLQGLLHTSRMGPQRPRPGDAIRVRLERIDRERRRLDLAAPEAAARTTAGAAEVGGTVRDVLDNGIVVDLDDGRSGWLPRRNVDLPAGTVLARRFRRGRRIAARIDGERPDGRRVVLTLLPDEAGDWRGAPPQPDGGFGTLGDLLAGWTKR